MLQAFQIFVGRCFQGAGLVQPGGRQRVEGVIDQGRLARPGHAGDAGEQAHRQVQRVALQVVAGGAEQGQPEVVLVAAALGGHLDALAAGKIVAGQGFLVGGHLLGGALGHHLAAVHAGAGADVDDVVGGADGVLVVFHHQHRVAQVAQPGEGVEQPFVIALVQADGGLVEHVHHAHQAGADLAGQTDALGLAAGQGLGAALQGQIVQPHVDQELQPVADLLEDLLGDLSTAAAELELVEVIERPAHRQAHHVGQIGVADEHVAGRLAQP